MAAMEDEARIASEFVSNIGELQELELNTKSALEAADAELATLSVHHAKRTSFTVRIRAYGAYGCLQRRRPCHP
jgi:hypothetical protein